MLPKNSIKHIPSSKTFHQIIMMSNLGLIVMALEKLYFLNPNNYHILWMGVLGIVETY
jgi:hypothetical protein